MIIRPFYKESIFSLEKKPIHTKLHFVCFFVSFKLAIIYKTKSLHHIAIAFLFVSFFVDFSVFVFH